MIARNITLLTASLLATLAATPLATASAQEAIMLETIGAVRMISPEELQRRDEQAAHERQRAEPAARQHAELAQ